MLSDQRLRTNHATVSMRLRITVNQNLWSKDEREILIEHAFEIYLQKRSKMTLEATDEIKTGHCRRRASYEDDDAVSISS